MKLMLLCAKTFFFAIFGDSLFQKSRFFDARPKIHYQKNLRYSLKNIKQLSILYAGASSFAMTYPLRQATDGQTHGL